LAGIAAGVPIAKFVSLCGGGEPSSDPAVVSLSNHAASTGAFQPSFDKLRTVLSMRRMMLRG
jgi:hypothetical protein